MSVKKKDEFINEYLIILSHLVPKVLKEYKYFRLHFHIDSCLRKSIQAYMAIKYYLLFKALKYKSIEFEHLNIYLDYYYYYQLILLFLAKLDAFYSNNH